MRILIIQDCAGVMFTIRKELIKRGHDVNMVYFDPRESGDIYWDYGETLVHAKKIVDKPMVIRTTLKKIMENYDIIHSYSSRFPNWSFPFDYVLAKMLNKKTVIHFHGTDLRKWYRRPVNRILLTNNVILVSTPDLLRFCPGRAIWLPQPVDDVLFSPEMNEPHDGLRVFHSCTDWGIKGTKYLIDACANLRKEGYDVELKTVGKGVNSVVKHDDMPKYYHWCDVVVNEILLPLHSIVGIEAMLCEKPVLCSFDDGLRKIYDPPIIKINKNNLCEILKSVYIQDNICEDYLERIGKLGRKWSLRYHKIDKVTDKLLEIYDGM